MTVKDAENIKLDPDVYSRCVATAKGYYRMLQRQREIEEEIIHETHAPDGQPRGSGTGDPPDGRSRRSSRGSGRTTGKFGRWNRRGWNAKVIVKES